MVVSNSIRSALNDLRSIWPWTTAVEPWSTLLVGDTTSFRWLGPASKIPPMPCSVPNVICHRRSTPLCLKLLVLICRNVRRGKDTSRCILHYFYSVGCSIFAKIPKIILNWVGISNKFALFMTFFIKSFR